MTGGQHEAECWGSVGRYDRFRWPSAHLPILTGVVGSFTLLED